ncbi:uncharacterized protein CMC5_046350 [Chondromyces crocatus]|uniref:Uncharacterized protein n=1 Tax=Chondromyces crocatus TaxID=52 RepID=A0A0K1EHZ4_CHOCO|nr:uncharacterized protein CMC5_046350 [Chondromyces crocatus]
MDLYLWIRPRETGCEKGLAQWLKEGREGTN